MLHRTRSALATLLVILGLTACTDTTRPKGVATVELNERADTLTAFGETRQLAALARDADGTPIAPKSISWSSSDPSIVSVDPKTGMVTALANGKATISAQLDGIIAGALFSVAQTVATVTVTPATASASALGVTKTFTAAAKDANGNAVAGAIVVWMSNGSVASIDQSGVATATGPGTATISANAGGIPGIATYTVDQVPTQLAITAQPTNAAAGRAISPAVQVEIQDAGGFRVSLARDAVTLSLSANATSATLAGSKTINAVGGVATFTGLSLDLAGSAYTLSAASGTLTAATSTAFDVTPSAPTRLAFLSQPSAPVAGATMAPSVDVAIEDDLGNVVASATNAITLALGTSSGAARLAGTATVNAVKGIASFKDLSLTDGGANYTLIASSLGLAPTASAAFTVVPLPTVQTLTVDRATVTSGDAATITATFAGGSATIDHGVGAVTSGVPISTGALTASTTFTITVTNSTGATSSAAIAVNVVAAPAITSFTAAQTTVTAGGATTVTAVFTGGDGVVNHGVGSVASGAAASTGLIQSSTSFTLTVTNAAGKSVTATIPIVTSAGPTIVGFLTTSGSSTVTITSGTSTTLTPVYAGGTGTIDHDVGAAPSGTAVSTGTLTASTSFTLTVTNAGGTSTSAVVNVVVVPPPAITSFAAVASTVTVGGNIQLVPTFTGGTGVVNNGVGSAASGATLSIPATATGAIPYTLTVTNAAGTSVTSTVTATVVAPPVITSLTAARTLMTEGESAKLTAIFSGGTASIDHSVGAVTSGISVTSVNTQVAQGPNVFRLTVTNAAGTTTSAVVTVDGVAAPVVRSFTFTTSLGSDLLVAAGTATALLPSFAGGTAVIDNGLGAVTSDVAVSVEPPTGTTFYTLTVTNAAGATAVAVARAFMIPPATITSFTAARAVTSTGDPVVLTPVFTGGVGAINGQPVPSGASFPAGNPVTTTTYTLTVTNQVGILVFANVTVTVVDPPQIQSFTAAPGLITEGAGVTLAPVFSGGIGVIDHGVGTVSSGVEVVSGPPTVGLAVFNLTVTNAAGLRQTAVASVSVVPPPSLSNIIPSALIVTKGDPVSLTVEFVGQTVIVDRGDDTSFVTAASASAVPVFLALGVLNQTTTFRIRAINTAGTVTTKQVLIQAVDPPSISAFDRSQATITAGSSNTLTGTFSGGTGTIDNGVGVVTSPISVQVTPQTTGVKSYTLTVTNAAGRTVTMTISFTVT